MLERLTSSLVEWLRGGPDSDVAISSRVRLARNVAGYPFLPRNGDRERARIEEILRHKIRFCDLLREMEYYRVDTMDEVGRQLLVERQLIGKEHAAAEWVRGVAFSPDERVSIVVNEEDHLRMQAILGGLRLAEAYASVNRVDDALAEVVPFSFSARYGYLTACPTNAGTGMRASVMMHVPALVMTQEMDRVLERAQELRLAVRGLFGEGTHGSADLYQVSNQRSLGVTEERIVEMVSRAAGEIIRMERNQRETLLRRHRSELSERTTRALELLRTAKALSSEEALHFLSQVRMGVQLGLVKDVALDTVQELFLLTLPAHLQTIEGKSADRLERNEMRARYLSKRLLN